jgi:type VI secretion system VasD/TssJ family lipoprotein
MYLLQFATGFLFLILWGCSSSANRSSAEQSVAVPYAQKGIHLSYHADSYLNHYEGNPSTLLLIVYQLESINGFSILSQTREGLLALLDGKEFDSSVMNVAQLFIAPGSSDNVEFDRAEKTRWVGIAAGYNSLDPRRSTCFYPIPIVIKGRNVPLVSKTKQEPGPLHIDLFLSASSIQNNALRYDK